MNGSGALISSATSQAGMVATGITLNSTGNFVNNGTITSSRGLNISANSIVNTAASGSNSQARLTASSGVNLNTASLTNDGLIKSSSGNVDIVNGSGNQSLTVNGTGGTIEATKGNINFNNATSVESANISINGGNLLSQQVNLNAGMGTINAALDQVTGQVNGSASVAHITASTADLKLGDLSTVDDPTYYNNAGNITIGTGFAATDGAALAIVASGNIIGNGGTINTSSTTGNGGDVTLIAGANFTSSSNTASGNVDTTSTLTLNGGSTTGGYIDLSGVTLTGSKTNTAVSIDTSSTTGSGSGGNVLMVAYAGKGANSGSIVATPTIAQSKGANPINTSGTSYGNLTIIGNGSSIQMQNVALGTSADGGTITVAATAPTVNNGPLTILNGAITAGSFSATTAPVKENISFGNLTGAAINLSTAGTLIQTKSTVLTATDTTLTAGVAGTVATPILTNTSNLLTVNGNSKSTIYVSEQNAGTVTLAGTSSVSGQAIAVTSIASSLNLVNLAYTNINVSEQNSGVVTLSGNSSVPGESIAVTSVASTLNIDNLTYTNVTVTDNGSKTVAGNIVINPGAVAGFQVGEVYSAAGGSTSALGTGTVKITASGNITDGGSSEANIEGQIVVLNSSGGSIGTTNSPLTIAAANLTANAIKGNVDIDDLVQTTLAAGSSGAASTNTYSVAGNGLVVNGAINGGNITLTAGPGTVSGGPGTVLDINASIGSTKTQLVDLTGSNGILQTLKTASVTGVNVSLTDSESGDIGSSSQAILTKASNLLTINGYQSSASPGGTTAFVSQTGNADLNTSKNNNVLTGSLNLTDSGTLTVVGAVDYGNVTITAPTVLLAGPGSITATNATFQSNGALLISGVATNNVGTIAASNSLVLGGLNGAAATSITIGNSKDGTLNPFAATLLNGGTSSVNNLTINTRGNFVSSLTELGLNSSTPGILNITAGNLVTSGPALGEPLVVSATGSSTAGTVNLNITGSQTVTLASSSTATVPAPFEVIAAGTSGGAINITTRGALNIDAGGLSTISGSGGTNLTLNSSKVTIGADSATTVDADNVTVITPALVLNAGSNLNATDSSTFTNKGALTISGAGLITAGDNLTLGSTTLGATSYVTTSITLGLKDGVSDPLAAQLGSYDFNTNTASGVLENLTISTTGNFTSGASALVLNPSSPGTLNITAANLVYASATPLNTTYILSGNSTGNNVSAGTVNLDLTGPQTVILGDSPGNIQITAISANSVGNASVSVTTKGNLLTGFESVAIDPNSSVTFTSSGTVTDNQPDFISPIIGNAANPVTGITFNVTGAKGVAFTAPVFADDDQGPTVTSLTINDGSTAPFTIGQNGQKNITNGSEFSIGEMFGQTSTLTNFSLTTGGGITFQDTGTLNMAPVSTLTLISKGAETILGDDNAITPGSTVYISGKSITLGTPNPEGTNNPLSALTFQSDPVNQLTITTPGTLTIATNQIWVDSSSNAGSFPQVSANRVVGANFQPAITPDQNFGFLVMTYTKILVAFGKSPNLLLEALLSFQPGGLGPQVARNGINALNAPASGEPTISITQTGTQAVTLGGNLQATTPTLNLAIGGTSNGNISFKTAGALTVGDTLSGSAEPGVSLNGGTVSLSSAGNMIVNSGGIALGTGTTSLTLASSRSLAVLDAGLLNGTDGALSSVSLSSASTSASPFVIGATRNASGVFSNGTAGSVLAPNVTILTNYLQNNALIGGGGTGTNSTLSLGSASSAGFSVIAGNGAFGAGSTNGFDNLSVTSIGNINLSGLLTGTATALSPGSVSSIYISTPGTVTFAPAALSLAVGPIAAGLSNAGEGGSIFINAKSIVAANGFTFDASSVSPGSDTAGSVSLTTVAPIIIGTAKGDFQINVSDVTAGTISLISSGAVTFNTVTSVGSGFVTGTTVAVNDTLQAVTALNITANQKTTGVITTGSAAQIIAPTSLTLTQTSTKVPTVALATQTSDLELAGGAFYIANSNSSATTNVNETTDNGANIASIKLINVGADSGTTTVGSISTTNGGISITDNTSAGTLSIASGSSLSTTNGSILLNQTKGAIAVGNDVTMHASGTAAGIGQISMITGTIPTGAVSIAGLAPQTASTTPTMVQTAGGSVFYGITGDTGGSITVNGSGTVLNALGRNITFYEGASTITLGGGDTITADPPVGSSAPISLVALPSTGIAAATATVTAAAAATATGTAISVGLPLALSNAAANLSLSPASNSSNVVASGAAKVFTANTSSASPTVSSMSNASNIPAVPTGLIAVGQNATTQSAQLASYQTTNSSTLTSSISATEEDTVRGATLISTDSKREIETKYGSVILAPHTVALVLNFDGGIAVYNLHDSGRDAVVIKSEKHTFNVPPGRNIVLTNLPVHYFEEVNPLQHVSYRKMVAREHGSGVKSFQSEFDIPSLLAGVQPLQTLTQSSQMQNRRLVDNILKTAALLRGFGSAEPYAQMRLPEMTAMAPVTSSSAQP